MPVVLVCVSVGGIMAQERQNWREGRVIWAFA